MKYCIEYAYGRKHVFVEGRKAVQEMLINLKDEAITDIRKIYKSGVSDSVLEKWKDYIDWNIHGQK